MKKFLLSIAAVFLLAGSAMSVESIVFIDLERTFNEFYKTQLAKSKVEVQQQDIEAERKIMVDEMTIINNEVDALKKEARDVTLTDEIRDSKRMLYEERLLTLRAKQKEIEEFTSRRQQQLQLQVSRMSQTIMDEIRQTVVEYAKKEGFTAVVDNSSRRAAIGVFIYTHPDVEITEAILVILNSKHPDVSRGGGLFDDGTETNKPSAKENKKP
ncbi:MAG: OmpH family outer membrane protein [Kiritimatiellaceae bacterium]|nr:OmpH family outer membrane protein [Kiritimatiellaceae bacterium]